MSRAGERDLRAGDDVALPTGEAGGHRVVNDADAGEPLRYLAVSTMDDPDATVDYWTGEEEGERDE